MAELWSDDEAAAFVRDCASAGEAVALRVYTSRLLGRDRSLVLHGGGNTSVKTTQRDLLGREVEVLCVNNKLSAVRALVQVAGSANAGMLDALDAGDADRAEHEFRKIGVALTKARQFQAEADACSGDDGVTPGVTEVEVTNEGLSETDDTERIDDGNTAVGDEPPGTSPFE